MINPAELKKIYTKASAAVLQAFNQRDTQAGTVTTPKQLTETINQFFIIYEKLGNNSNQSKLFNAENISSIGEQTIDCLTDLADWAERLDLHQESLMLGEIALAVAHWVIRKQGEIRNLEVIVNILASKANRTSDKALLTSLFHVINDVIEHATADAKSDQDKTDPKRPWRMLNFNFAIVATRTMEKSLMVRAFDTLGRNLPEECPSFFEEGLKQSEKPVYDPEIKIIMTEYFKKWATLH